jgi:hypothetical protein
MFYFFSILFYILDEKNLKKIDELSLIEELCKDSEYIYFY